MATETADSATIIEHDGKMWKPKPGASATAEEFVAARTLMVEIHRDARWNPWVSDDRAAELEAAMNTFERWTRAEPGFRPKTERQVDAWMARMDREFEAKRKRQERERERNQKRYDAAREQARLALLEDRASEHRLKTELEGHRSGQTFPGVVGERRRATIAELEEKLTACQQRIGNVLDVVGDPETVVDERGRLPRDRRQLSLWRFSWRREEEVRTLRFFLAERRSALAGTKEKAKRAEIRRRLRESQNALDTWLAIPPLTPNDMCSECVMPLANHLGSITHSSGPCPAWPRHAAHLRKWRAMFDEMVRASQPPPPTPPPRPEPLAVVPSGLPIAEVMKRLGEIQQEFPDAVIRRGRANRWEAWRAEA